MDLHVWFWLFYVLGLLFGFWSYRIPNSPYPWERGGGHLLVFILIGLLGYKVFGGPIQ